MKYKTPKIVQSSGRRWYLWLLLIPLLAGAAVGWRGFLEMGKEYYARARLQPMQEKLEELRRQITTLEAERTAMREQLVAQNRSNQIDLEASRQARESLQKRELECLQMEEELMLLRQMISTGEKDDELKVIRLSLEAGPKSREFRYRFTVSKTLGKPALAVGWIYLSLEGEVEGTATKLDLQEITEEKIEKIKMRFKHFQDVEGLIRLPSGFQPRKLTIDIKPERSKLPKVQKSFDWVLTG
jgi:hypothetical protein